jgi:elongation factor P
MYLLLNGEVNTVEWFQHHKPGKGPAFMKVKIKSVRSGKILEKTFRTKDKIVQAIVDKSTKQFLYKNGDKYVFMDTADYSQIEVPQSRLDGKKEYLIEGEEVDLTVYEGEVIEAELPPQIKMEVTVSSPGIKGDTVSGSTKKVTLETGLVVDVPLFINQGESIVVDTRTGEYVSRAD